MPQAWKDRSKLSRFIKSSWTNTNLRCGKYVHLNTPDKNTSYINVKICMSRDVYKAWCISQREHIESLQRPSLDRIDNNGDYSIDNIQIIELADNIRKNKTVFTANTGRCYACKEVKSIEEFINDKRRTNGKASLCLTCSHDINKRKYEAKKCKQLDSTGG